MVRGPMAQGFFDIARLIGKGVLFSSSGKSAKTLSRAERKAQGAVDTARLRREEQFVPREHQLTYRPLRRVWVDFDTTSRLKLWKLCEATRSLCSAVKIWNPMVNRSRLPRNIVLLHVIPHALPDDPLPRRAQRLATASTRSLLQILPSPPMPSGECAARTRTLRAA